MMAIGTINCWKNVNYLPVHHKSSLKGRQIHLCVHIRIARKCRSTARPCLCGGYLMLCPVQYAGPVAVWYMIRNCSRHGRTV